MAIMTLADELRQYRLDHRMTWAQLAGVLGMSTAGLWKIATGKCIPREMTEHDIRRRLGWPPLRAPQRTTGLAGNPADRTQPGV